MAFKQLPSQKSALLLGPPDNGKFSTLKTLYAEQSPLLIDLEDWSLLNDLLRKPQLFKDILNSLSDGEYLTINRLDRIYKYFPLLTETIKRKKIIVAGTAVSLPDPASDELGELFDIHYFGPKDFFQIENSLVLSEALAYGTLPVVFNSDRSTEKIKYLKNYLQNFLDLEILTKDQVRNLVPFHLFLPLAADSVGKNLNSSWLSQTLDINYKTIQHYYDLFGHHQAGFYLPAFSQQLRRVQLKAPRFYFFDTGFQRALAGRLDHSLYESSSEYDLLFKTWIISQIHILIRKYRLPLKMSYLETKDGVNIDLILEDIKGDLHFVNFCTAPRILPLHFKSLRSLGKTLPEARLHLVTPKNFSEFFNQIFRTAQDGTKVLS